MDKRVEIINSFRFLPFQGSIKMHGADEEFTVFEQWQWNAVPLGLEHPDYYHFGRRITLGARHLPQKFDLKKRRYISRTSMDSELSLVTANIALAGPGKLMYDPFVGTGSFPIACAEFGAVVFGSDIDGRCMRGDGDGKTLRGNFEQYGLLNGMAGFFSADLTNSPIQRIPPGKLEGCRPRRIFDGIVCDPPYGVREGLYVLGVRDPQKRAWVMEAGMGMYK
jgi:tRNA (guanine10-N2)-methyltransferase